LKRRLAAIEARLNTNAGNSSTPPSANPIGATPPVVKKKSKLQPGHPPHLKHLLPPDRVTRTETIAPTACAGCGAALAREAGPTDPEPAGFQVVELPPLAVEVTEYQGHGRTCQRCGYLTRATIPAAMRAHSVGLALVSGRLAELRPDTGHQHDHS
jgi:hypothetical protein